MFAPFVFLFLKRFIGQGVDERFTPDDFKTEVFLGTGSFGRVTLVTFKNK